MPRRPALIPRGSGGRQGARVSAEWRVPLPAPWLEIKSEGRDRAARGNAFRGGRGEVAVRPTCLCGRSAARALLCAQLREGNARRPSSGAYRAGGSCRPRIGASLLPRPSSRRVGGENEEGWRAPLFLFSYQFSRRCAEPGSNRSGRALRERDWSLVSDGTPPAPPSAPRRGAPPPDTPAAAVRPRRSPPPAEGHPSERQEEPGNLKRKRAVSPRWERQGTWATAFPAPHKLPSGKTEVKGRLGGRGVSEQVSARAPVRVTPQGG